MRRGVVASLFLVMALYGTAFAAENPNVTVSARVLKSQVKIGDEVRLLLQVEHPRKFTVHPPDEKLALEEAATRHGFQGVSDFVRAAALDRTSAA